MSSRVSKQYSQLKGCSCALLRKSSRVITQIYEEALRPAGINPSQFTVLSVLVNAGPLPMTQLAEVMMIDRTGLTRNIKVLHKNGWVEYQFGADKRVKLVVLTALGKATLDAALPLWRRAQDKVSGVLGDLSSLQDKLNALVAAG